MRRFFGLGGMSLFLSFLFTSTGCVKDKAGDVEALPKASEILGNVKIPVSVPLDKIGTLQILSGFYKHPVTDEVPTLNNRTNGRDKFTVVSAYPNFVQIHTILNNDEPFMYGISINPQVGDQIDFNEESTTISLVFLHPLIRVNDPSKATVIIQKIKAAPSFLNLKNEVLSLMITGSLSNQTPYIEPANLANYKYVVGETLHQLNDNANIDQSGLAIIENRRVGNEVQFKVLNYKKRFCTIYAHKYNNGQLTNTPIKLVNSSEGYVDRQWIEAGSFDWIEGWMGLFRLQPQDQIIQESDWMAVDVTNAEKIYLKCYGLGIAGNGIPPFNSEEFTRGAGAMAMTAVFDYVIPTIEAVGSIKGLPNAGDLRGRPNTDPLRKLIDRFAEHFNSSTIFHAKLFGAAAINDREGLMEVVYDEVRDFLLDPDNVKLYWDIIKKYVILTEDQKGVLLKSLSAVAKVKAWADLAGTIVNLGESVYATTTSRWTTEFRLNTDGSSIPTAGLIAYYPLEGNATDESGNGKHGTIMNTPVFEDGVAGKAIKLTARCTFGWCEGEEGDHVLLPVPAFEHMNAFSINLWVKENSLMWPDGQGYIFFGNHLGNLVQIAHLENEMRFSSSGSSNISVPFASSNLNQFVMYTLVYDNGVLKAYQNGNQVGSLSNATRGPVGSTGALSRHWGISTYTRMNGSIDQVRIYDRPLTPTEITTLFTMKL